MQCQSKRGGCESPVSFLLEIAQWVTRSSWLSIKTPKRWFVQKARERITRHQSNSTAFCESFAVKTKRPTYVVEHPDDNETKFVRRRQLLKLFVPCDDLHAAVVSFQHLQMLNKNGRIEQARWVEGNVDQGSATASGREMEKKQHLQMLSKQLEYSVIGHGQGSWSGVTEACVCVREIVMYVR